MRTTGLALLLALALPLPLACGVDDAAPPTETVVEAAIAPPAIWLSGLRPRECNDPISLATAGRQAMLTTGFSANPFVDTNLQFVTAVNGSTKAIITADPGNPGGPNTTPWMDVFTTSQTDSATAQTWRNSLRTAIANQPPPVDCDPSPRPPSGPAPTAGPAVTTFWFTRSFAVPCSGFNQCVTTAREAIVKSGFPATPVIQNQNLVVAFSADTSLAVECVQFGDSALISIWAASSTNNTGAVATSVRNNIIALKCL